MFSFVPNKTGANAEQACKSQDDWPDATIAVNVLLLLL
jgi:hypothetical protein